MLTHASRQAGSWLICDVRQKMRRVYRFKSGALHFNLPADWDDACDENAVSFSSPTRDAALTISVHDTPRMSPTDIERVTADKKPFGVPRSEKRVLSVLGGTGYAQEFEKQSVERSHWLAHFLFFAHATVIASVNGTSEEMRDHHDDFEKILSSIHSVAAPK